MLPCESHGEDLLSRVWNELPRLRTVSIAVTCGRNSSTNWGGAGEAKVTPEAHGAGWLLSEDGHLELTGSRRQIHFTNAYRWERRPDRLLLFQQRRGAAEAVFLLDFEADGNASMAARRSHTCGSDLYRGRITLTGDGMDLTWTIAGPRKNERLFCRYRRTGMFS